MATRMQQRKGTAAQWISTNSGQGPVLNAGEIGFEIDTNKFKIGDGVNHWVDLVYFTDSASALAAINAVVDAAPAALNTLNELAAAINDDPAFFTTMATNLANHEADTTNVHGIADTALLATKSYADNAVSTHNNDTTNVHGILDTADLATQEYVTDAIGNATVNQSALAGDGITWNDSTEQYDVDNTVARVSSTQTALDLKANIDSPTFTGTVSGVTKTHVGLGNVDNTSDANKPVSTATQTALDLKAPLAGPIFTGTTRTDDLVVDGDFTVNGTNFAASATSITIEDNMIQLAHENAANTVDLGLVVSYNYTGSAGMHAGIVRDVSENTWKLFKNVETEPSTTVDFAEGELDDLKLGTLQAESATIGGVNNTEIQYLNGVTSAIQDQLDDKLESATAASTYAPIASPTFTGTVSGVTKAHVGLGNVDNTADADKDISDLTQAALDLKAPLANPTFTGTVAGIDKSMVGLGNVDNTSDADKPISDDTQTALNDKANIDGPTLTGIVTLPSSTFIGDVTSTEIGYLEGVTSAIQDQLDNKLASSTASSTYAPLAGPTFTGTVAGITKTMVGLANVDNTADTDKPVSTDTQAALDLKADLNAPTFTGTVSGITKSMVGLANVDNTADADKPISDDTQTALDLKAPLANPTFTGTVAGITKSMVGLGSVDNTSDANKPISTATQNALDLKAPLANPTFTGTVTLPANTISQVHLADDSVGTNEIGGLAVTESKIANSAVTNAKLAGSIDWTKLSVSSTVSATELGYVDGVTSSIQTQLDDKLSKTGGTMTGALTLSGAPTIDLHAATKAYVDNVVSGLNFHQPVRVATTANITLSGTQTIDGVAVIAGDRVLVKDQTDQKTNGIYTVASSTWSRSTDADNTPDGELKGGDFTLVLEGTANEGYGYVCSNTSAISIGTTNITYAPFNAAKAVTAGTGLTESAPGTLAIATGGVTSGMIADATIVDADISASAAIAQSKISGLSSSLSAKADLASPTFTGTVTIPSGAALGTPASATLTNATGLPVSTGISGLGTGVATFLATPSSANLASMVTDEIGTGNLVLSDIATNAQTASYTLVLADKAKLVEMNVASANNVTVPPNSSVALPVGSKIDILQVGAGQTTIVAGAGVTVNATPGLKLRAQWSSATLIKRATDTWVLVGDISA